MWSDVHLPESCRQFRSPCSGSSPCRCLCVVCRESQRAPSTMRSRLLVTLVLAIFSAALLLLIASRIVRFSHIFRTHAGPALTQEQVELAYNRSIPAERQQVIPLIIHQIFHNFHDALDTTIPDDWEAQRQSCIKFNPDFEYRVRTLSEPLFAVGLLHHQHLFKTNDTVLPALDAPIIARFYQDKLRMVSRHI